MGGKTRKTGSTYSRKHPQPIGGAVEAVMGMLGLSRRYHGWVVMHRWPEIVGDYLAARSSACRFDDGTLYVAVDNAVLRQEMDMQKDELLRKIHALPGGRVVQRLRLVGSRKGRS